MVVFCVGAICELLVMVWVAFGGWAVALFRTFGNYLGGPWGLDGCFFEGVQG